jgi:hypothetical protein
MDYFIICIFGAHGAGDWPNISKASRTSGLVDSLSCSWIREHGSLAVNVAVLDAFSWVLHPGVGGDLDTLICSSYSFIYIS